MNISQSIPSTVQSISFSFLTTEDIRRISVKQIINPTLLDDLNRPNLGGLYDPALGPSDRDDLCVVYLKLCRLLNGAGIRTSIGANRAMQVTIHVRGTLDILTSPHPSSTHFSWLTCLTFSARPAYSAITSRRKG